MEPQAIVSPSTPKPKFVSKYEPPEVKSIYINRFHTTGTLLAAIFLLFSAILIFLINNGPPSYRDFLVRIVLSNFSGYFSTSVGNSIAFLSLLISLIAFARYYVPSYIPGYEKMSNKQRALLGLPPLPSGSVIKESITPTYSTPIRSPHTPVFPPSRSTTASPSPISLSGLFSPVSPSASSPFGTPDMGLRYRRKETPMNSPMEIRDEQQLEGYLRQYDESERSKVRVDANAVPLEGFSSPMPKYRPAFRPPPRNSPRDADFGYVNTQNAIDLLEKLGINHYMEEWTTRMRIWIVAFILKPLVVKMNMVEKVGLSINNVNIPSVSSQQPLWHTSPQVSTPLFPNLNTSTFSPQTATGVDMNEILKERHKLEKFVKVLGVTSREYLSGRIRELAQGDFMAAFRWNSGGSWKEKEWTPEVGPTDAQIIIHLFCTFMDLQLPDFQSTHEKPFSSRHFVCTPDTPDASKSSSIIYQRHIHPPHFEVVSSSPTENWAVCSGRNNLFQAAVLFIYCCKIKFSGYLGQAHLSAKNINLLSVIETEDL